MLPQSDRRRASGFSERKKLNFFKLEEGRHLVRFLQPLSSVKLSHTHWIRGTSIECPGEETCPICHNNKKILMQVDNDYNRAKDVPGFNNYQLRYYANVLDKTPVKISPNSETGYENKKKPDGTWPVTCAETGDFLEQIEPTVSNTVKILSGGVTLFTAFEDIAKGTLDEQTEEPIGLENYDLVLMVSGKSRDRKVTPLPQLNRNEVVNLEDYELFDLERALIVFTPEEIQQFVSGVSLKDIFAERRAQSSQETEVVTFKEDVTEELEEKAETVSDMANQVKNILDANK